LELEALFEFPGTWKNIDELEEHLTRQELFKMVEKARKQRYQQMKFAAAIQGVDLDEGSADEDFERVKARAEARIHGITEEEFELDGLIDIIDEDE